MLNREELEAELTDLTGDPAYPKVSLLFGLDRVFRTVALFAIDKDSSMVYGYEVPEAESRIHYRIEGVFRQDGVLCSRSFCRC